MYYLRNRQQLFLTEGTPSAAARRVGMNEQVCETAQLARVFRNHADAANTAAKLTPGFVPVYAADALDLYEVVSTIAAEVIGIETLVEQGSDRRDFHEVNVLSVEQALVAAYAAGLADASK